MKFLLTAIIFLTTSFSFTTPNWGHNFKEAITAAQKEHKYILLNFSGSDWCGPCIKLHKEVFVMDVFTNLANNNLILLNADFPRAKKNQLSAAQQQLNNEMADKYNSKGIFPLTVLLDAQGNIIKTWEGFPTAPLEFINDIQHTIQDQH